MNLDEQLRAALNLEAEMVQTPIPDTRTMIKGGQDRRRRRNAAWAGGGVAAAVLIAGGLYAVVQGSGDPDSGQTIVGTPTVSVTSAPTPSDPPDWLVSDDAADVEPGTYRLLVGQRPDLSFIEADLTFGATGWQSSDVPVFENDAEQYGAAGVRQIGVLPGAADYCHAPDDASWDTAARPAAATTKALARQFAELPNGTVVQPITATRALGHEAFHLRMRIHDDCDTSDGSVYLAFTTTGSSSGPDVDALAISYRETPAQDNILDLLVVDLDGTPVVAYYWHEKGADPALVAEVSSVRDSITFVPSE